MIKETCGGIIERRPADRAPSRRTGGCGRAARRSAQERSDDRAFNPSPVCRRRSAASLERAHGPQGVTRAFGADLRRAIARATRNRLLAFGIGIAVTALLQSGTATALIVTSFVTRRLMTDGAAIAVILGANVGTTLVAQALSVPFSGLAPAFLLVGVLMFSRAKATRWHDFGRIAIGLRLMLLSLDLIVTASAPLRGSPVLAELLASLQGYDVFAVLIAAGLAWLVPSSLALILLVMSLVAGQVEPIPVALNLVLGINLGATVAPLMASREGPPEAQRAVIVNTGLKALGCLAALPLLPTIGPLVAAIDHDSVPQVVDFHTLFNLVWAAHCCPSPGLRRAPWLGSCRISRSPTTPAAPSTWTRQASTARRSR